MGTTKKALTGEYRAVSVMLPVDFPVLDHEGEWVVFNAAATAEKMPAEFVKICEGSWLRVVRDSKSGKTPAEYHALTAKKVGTWEETGNFTIVERSDSMWVQYEKAYKTAEMKALGDKADSDSPAAIKSMMGKTVTSILGAKAKNTFANFLEAKSIEIAKAEAEEEGARSKEVIFELLVDKYAKMAKAGEETAKAESGKITLSEIKV
jgi:hypothetical protein